MKGLLLTHNITSTDLDLGLKWVALYDWASATSICLNFGSTPNELYFLGTPTLFTLPVKKIGALGMICGDNGLSTKFIRYQGIDSLEEGIINGESVKNVFGARFKYSDQEDLLLSLQTSIDKKMKFKIDVSDTPDPWDELSPPYGYFRVITAVCVLFPIFGIIHILYVLKTFLNEKKGIGRRSYLLVSLIFAFLGNFVRIIVFTDMLGVNYIYI